MFSYRIMQRSLMSLTAVLLGVLIPGCAQTPALTVDANLNGLSEEELVTRYGNPPHCSEYRLGDAVGEFRTGLQSFFPMPQSRDVGLRELTWDFTNAHLTAWLHHTNAHWVVFDSLRYQTGIQF